MKTKLIHGITAFGACLMLATAPSVALAYDGTQCKEPGNCWQPKPGYPEKVAGTKYDPKHNAKEVAKQQNSIKEMEARNKLRVDHFKRTGEFIYDVKKIPAS